MSTVDRSTEDKIRWEREDDAEFGHDEPKIRVLTNARFGCTFSPNGMCAVHRTSILDHSAIETYEEMTLEEARRRYPDTDPAVWEQFPKS